MARNPAFALRDEQEPRSGRWRKRGQLLANVTAPTDGQWVEIGGMYPLTITIEGDLFEGSVEVCVSNAEIRPANSVHGALLGPPVTTAREVQYISAPFVWAKLRVTILNNGEITEANLYGGESG